MAKRWPGEINAGSMADIAFLILIYFLMTTTMDVEEGIPQKLPPGKIEDIFTKINERDVFEIIINGQNEIMVEEEKLHDVSLLKEKVKEFLTNPENKAALPQLDEVTVFIARDSIVRLKAELQVLEQNEPQSSLISVKKSILSLWEDRLAAAKKAGSYRTVPRRAIISITTDKKVEYGTYIQIHDGIQQAYHELRNEWSQKVFHENFTDWSEFNPEHFEKIKIIRTIVPMVIAEQEPVNIDIYH